MKKSSRYKIGKRIARVTAAKNLQGYLLRSGSDFVFRVYGKNKNIFKDYEITLSDLEIRIVDSDAALYETKGSENIIDYSPKTLGLKKHRS